MRADGIGSILIFDNCRHTSQILRDTLWMAGIDDVVFCHSEEETRDQLEYKPWDCFILDWDDRGGTDLSIVEWLRKSRRLRNREIAVVLCTSRTERQFIERARDAGVTEVVAKPVVAGELMKKIIAGCTRKREFVDQEVFAGPDRRRRKAEVVEKERRKQ